MTIDKQVFATGMGLLAGNFSRTVDAAVSRAWYSILNERMTDEQFRAAIAHSIAEDTYWPTAASLMAKVAPPSLESQGHDALEHVNRVLGASGGYRYLSHDTYHAEFDAPTRAAISAVGGLAEICNVPIERYGTLAKKFAAAYAKSLSPTPVLPAAGIDPRVKQLVRDTTHALSGRDRSAGERP